MVTSSSLLDFTSFFGNWLRLSQPGFGKEYRNVLDSINKIMSGPAYISAGENHFSQSTYYDEQGKPRPMYVMDKDGFSRCGPTA